MYYSLKLLIIFTHHTISSSYAYCDETVNCISQQSMQYSQLQLQNSTVFAIIQIIDQNVTAIAQQLDDDISPTLNLIG